MKKVFLFIILIITICMGWLKSYVDVVPTSNVTFKKEEGLVYAIDNIPDTITATDSMSKDEEDLVCSIFSGLVEMNEEGEPIPDLAKAWKVSDDGLEYTMKIKENMKWSNGEEITAESFQLFFRDLLSPDNDLYASDELNTIYGVKEYREGKHDFSKVAINTPDKYTITIRMNNKDDELLKKLSKPVYRLRNLNDPLSNYKEEFNNISYTGPYIIEEITEDGFINLIYNPYSDAELEIKEVLLKEKEGDEMELAALNLNKVDIIRNPPIINSEGFELYKDTSIFVNDEANVMILNENIKDGLYTLLKNWIGESSIVENKLGTPHIEILNEKNINDVFKKKDEIELEVGKTYDEESLRLFKEAIMDKGVLKIIINDDDEKRVLANELSKELEKYNIKSIIKVYREDFKEALRSIDFDITFIDINKESIKTFFKNKNINASDEEAKINGGVNTENNSVDKEKNEIKEKEDKVVISMYLKNDLWCKSDRVSYTYIDGNGNLILKYSGY